MSEDLENNEPLGVIKATTSDEFNQKVADQYARNLEKYAPMESYMIRINGTEKKFKRRKILGGEHKVLETMRQKLVNAVRKSSMEAPAIEDQLYKKCANYYLIDAETNQGMTEDQFDFGVFEDIKVILDACAYRTEKPIPPLEMT